MIDALFNQIHLIPFDIGCPFIDPLAVDNKEGISFALSFINRLKEECKESKIDILGSAVSLGDNKISFEKNKLADNMICYAKLNYNLYCYILSNGIGVFVLIDFDNQALDLEKHRAVNSQNITIAAAYQKKLTQSTILDKYEGADVLPELEQRMLNFRKKCWKIVNEGAKKKQIKHIRKYSGDIKYKTQGLSYVLTIHIFDSKTITEKEIDALLFSNIYSSVMDDSKWETINAALAEYTSNIKENVVTPNSKVCFAWSGIALTLPKLLTSYEDLLDNSCICS